MNNDELEKYAVRKYSIAVAIAVIRSKPQGVPLTEFIKELRTKSDSNLDLFQDIFISEADFDNSDEEIADVNEDFENEKILSNHMEKNYNSCNSKTVSRDLQTAAEFKNGSDRQNDRFDVIAEVVNTCEANFDDSISILRENNVDTTNPTQEGVRNDSIKEILDIFKEIDTPRRNEGLITTSTPKQCTQSTLCVTSQINISENFNVGRKETVCATSHYNSKVDGNENGALSNNVNGSQETELYTLNGYTDNFTYISQSQDVNITIPTNLLHRSNKKDNTLQYNANSNKRNELEIGNNKVANKIETSQYSSINSKSEIIVPEKQIFDTALNDNNMNIDKININTAKSSNALTNDDAVGNKTHVTANNQTSSDEYNFLFTHVTKNFGTRKPSLEEPLNNNNFKNLSESFDKTIFTNNSFLRSTEISSSCFRSDSLNKHLQIYQENSMTYNAEPENDSIKETHTLNLSDNEFLFLSSVGGSSKTDECNATKKLPPVLNAKRDDQVNNDMYNYKCAQFESGYETQCPSKNDRILDDQNEMEDKSDSTNTTEEIVTFKIFEELNRIKNYIGRQDRRLSDSGRSNSQGSQLSGVRINESGYCLLNYIMECPLVLRTMEITEEVSQVLGKLVDKLHEEENYPQFLEKILEKVQELLTDIYEGYREDLLKKEEQTNRILLLNRSKNITMYTIEKVLPILDDACAMLQNNDVMEISCLEKCENLCYVFHLLEILLKRHNAAAASSQASTQISQDEDKSLKRSTITEIWSKKWNLSKSDVSEGSFKKKCALTQISEILNKIIVKGMDGYSLIAFAALQSFNLLQSK